MSLFQVNKPKSASKIMIPSSSELQESVTDTLQHIAEMVGVTLGPGGRQVLIERPEIGMKPIVSKDGVTVIKNLGYHSAIQQLILESVRDASVRTASEAGDGTTTATILSAGICSETAKAVKVNKKVSPQKIVREMYALFPWIETQIGTMKIDVNSDVQKTLLSVATLSANGDTVLASKVMEALDIVGDEGNLTIIESQGASSLTVDKIHGYTVDVGYEDSCRNFANGFINDKSGTMVALEKPLIILFDGVINDTLQVIESLSKLGQYFVDKSVPNRSVVLVAHGFGDGVLGDLHLNWNAQQSQIQVYPLLTPKSPIANSRTEFLYDLQAYTGSTVFNPIDKPLIDMNIEFLVKNNKVKSFESGRFRSSVVVEEDPDRVALRVDELKLRLEKPESQYEINDLNVRIGKLTSGIARLTISAPSQGETRERRDRAEDAWMAIRGAIKFGAIPGGGYSLVRLSAGLSAIAAVQPDGPMRTAMEILSEAMLKPVRVLYQNYGYNAEEIESQIAQLLIDDNRTFDLSEEKWVSKIDVLDSVPAVLEAIRNSLSIASLLGTLGGIVAFERDGAADTEERKYARRFQNAIGE